MNDFLLPFERMGGLPVSFDELVNSLAHLARVYCAEGTSRNSEQRQEDWEHDGQSDETRPRGAEFSWLLGSPLLAAQQHRH